jgi:serpin B
MSRCLGYIGSLALLAAVLPGAWAPVWPPRCAAAEPSASGDRAVDPDAKTAAASINGFAWELYRELAREPGNRCCSPYSIAAALSVAYGGAAGETRQQFARLLHVELPDERWHRAVAGLLADGASDMKRPYELLVANRLWCDAGYTFLPDYLRLAREVYAAPPQQAQFRQQPEAARQTINTWVQQQTRDKIRDLFPSGSINQDTRLVIANAVYFLGTWESMFDERQTRPAPFHLSTQKQVDVPTMYQKAHFLLTENDRWQALQLPYRGGRLAMVVVVPRAVDGLAEIEAAMNAQRWSELLATAKRREVQVHLPKFVIHDQFSLNDTLQALGLRDAFRPTVADFSGMDGTRELFIQAVVHKAMVDVNERGTEAAAATGISIGVTSLGPPPAEFRADRPFLFGIVDRQSGLLLFAGRVSRPEL